jgi:hypothetical protein
MMMPIVLDECRPLFRDDGRYEEFVAWLAKKLGKDFSPVLAGQKVLGSVLSPEATKEVLYDRMIQRISGSPSILDDIRDRLENDEIVE